MERAKPVRLDSARCPECDACMDLAPLLLARDLAIVSGLLQELNPNHRPSLERQMKTLVARLAKQSIELCTTLGLYGYEYLGPDEEGDEGERDE